MKISIQNIKTNAYFFLIIGVLCLSVSPLFVRWIDAPGIIISFYRMIFVSLVLTPFVFIKQKNKPQIRNTLSTYHARLWLIFPILAGVGSGFDHAFWSSAINLTSVANAILINYISPVWVALVGILFLKEHHQKIFWGGLALVLIGASVISQPNFSTKSIGSGEFLGLISSFFYAAYFIFTQKSREHFDALFHTWLSGIFAAIILGLVALILDYSFFDYTIKTWIGFLLAGLISQLCGYLSMAKAMGDLPASIVSPFMVLQPVMTALLAILFLGEFLSGYQIIGGIGIIIGIWLVTKSSSYSKLD